ncbi:uridine nucleosidase [Exidia glandulosa HHB12029]|uniref:Uridine nucleosidase n=1 Tax=Exidia glandulosa HHB12029 TaxID=1314781 RepID=A0A165ZG00_EXIGL|nr:uridine nucleosidase [Exidia glandulosa HHB12029]
MKVWLDCDPGHDDALAILLALHTPGIELVGLSTVHGNAHAHLTLANAGRLLHAFAAPAHLKPHGGAPKPLLRTGRVDLEIHGLDGLGGVEGLPPADSSLTRPPDPLHAVEGLRAVLASAQPDEISVVTTGPMTNFALFASMYPELVPKVKQLVFMGGGVGVGNRSAVAEYNILCDPEAAQIVLELPIPKVMIPLNVTHTAIFTTAHMERLNPTLTPLRHTLSTLLFFFAHAYRDVFGFLEGPPLHDALTIAYLVKPELFTGKRQHVDIELHGERTAGETVVDVWDYLKIDASWGRTGRNCFVTETLDVEGFFNLFFACVDACDQVSPLNQRASS